MGPQASGRGTLWSFRRLELVEKIPSPRGRQQTHNRVPDKVVLRQGGGAVLSAMLLQQRSTNLRPFYSLEKSPTRASPALIQAILVADPNSHFAGWGHSCDCLKWTDLGTTCYCCSR